MRSGIQLLQIARNQIQKNLTGDEVSGAALLVKGDDIVAIGQDCRQLTDNPIAYAEMEAIRLAGRRSDQATLTLYSTHYPNMLIAGTLLQFSIGALVIGQPPLSSSAIDLLKSKGVPVSFCAAHE